MKPWMKWAIAGVVVVVLAVVVGPFVYFNFIRDDPPEELSLDTETATSAPVDASAPADTSGDTAGDPADTTSAATSTPATDGDEAAASGIAGSWTATGESVLGYRVKEILFGQDTEGVGRTNAVTGGLEVEGTTVTAADFEVDMASVESDEDRRDSQFRGRIMDVEQFPTATFVLTAPIELGAEPEDGARFTATATGDLTLRGTTKPVTVDLEAERSGDVFRVAGSIPVVFEEWGIPNPSNPVVSTADNGLLEFLLVFARA